MTRKRYPLGTLLRLREHRTEAARQVLLERQRQTQVCRDQCIQIESEITALRHQRAHHRAQLLAAPAPGMSWPTTLEQRERHIDHLADLATAARARLSQAKQALQQAEQAQDEARTAYFQARSRQEALEKRRDVWRREQRILEDRREEAAAEELLLGRRLPLMSS